MSLKQTLCAYELIDSAVVNGDDIVALFKNFTTIEASSKTVRDGKGQSDFVRIVIPGTHGKRQGNHAPTLGIIGRLGVSERAHLVLGWFLMLMALLLPLRRH